MSTALVLPPRWRDAVHRAARPLPRGRVEQVVGLHIEVAGVDAAIGDLVEVEVGGGDVACEVIALRGEQLVCMPFGDLHGVRAGAPVTPTGAPHRIGVGRALLGRVIDGLGRPMDGRPLPAGLTPCVVAGSAPNPLERVPVTQQLSLGVAALDTLVPCGRGQRMGIFAGSGVGKSSLLSMMIRGTDADVSVLALVGERGREVQEFIERDLGPEGLARSVVVVATSDEPALARLRAALTATRIAEFFRDEGADVLLLMDSVTRFCMAQREVGLSAGEPPATRGYPPSTFALLARLLERAGNTRRGSITGLYTVLVDGDDMNEPVADAARGILDGHVVLSRRLAQAGHFPTIDVLDSVSRVVGAITSPEQRAAAVALRQLLAAHRDARDLIDIGAYVPGSNPVVDRAVALEPSINAFLRQDIGTVVPAWQSWQALGSVLRGAA